MGNRPNTRRLTSVAKMTLSPVWEETFEIDDYVRGDSITFTVFDKDLDGNDDLLGRAVLPASKFSGADGFSGSWPLLLRKKVAGKIRVQVTIMDALEAEVGVSIGVADVFKKKFSIFGVRSAYYEVCTP